MADPCRDQDAYRCPACGDTMPAKYRNTHPVLCAVASLLIEPQVDRLIEHLAEGGY